MRLYPRDDRQSRGCRLLFCRWRCHDRLDMAGLHRDQMGGLGLAWAAALAIKADKNASQVPTELYEKGPEGTIYYLY
jgi:hypothetical protein